MNNHVPHFNLIAAVIEAAKPHPPGTIVRVETDAGDGANTRLVGFGAKVSLDGPANPAFSPFLAMAGWDCLKTLASEAVPKECIVYVDRGGNSIFKIEKLSQWSFVQEFSQVIACAIGDESGHKVIEAILTAADEWRSGKHRLFDEEGDRKIVDENRGIAVRVDAPKNRHAAIMTVVHIVSAFIAGLYAVSHLWQLSPYLAIGAITAVFIGISKLLVRLKV